MTPVSPCREPASSDPIPMPIILLFRNDSSLPGLEPSCYEPNFERFNFGPAGYPNTMLFVNELPDQEQYWLNVRNSIDEYEDDDDDHSMGSSRFSSQSGWRSAVRRLNMNFAKCFRPPATQSFRNIPVTPSVISSPPHSIVTGGEDRSILWQEDIEDIEEEEEEEGEGILLEEEEEEAVEYDAVSHPTASPSSSPSNSGGEVYQLNLSFDSNVTSN